MSEKPAGRLEDERRLLSNLVATRPRRERSSALAAAGGSLGFHGVLVAGLIWLTMSAAHTEQVAKTDPLVLYTPVPETPPPPVAPPPPTPPPAASKAVMQLEKTVATAQPAAPTPAPAPARGFQTLTPPTVTPPDIPPPTAVAVTREADFTGEGVEGGTGKGKSSDVGAQKTVTSDDISAAPTFTPFTVAPSLKNREEVARALQRDYPDDLRGDGISGNVLVWFLIDENGRVQKFQIKESSGHDELDHAALKVASIMRFSPALNRDQRVPVWVALPIAFHAQAAG